MWLFHFISSGPWSCRTLTQLVSSCGSQFLWHDIVILYYNVENNFKKQMYLVKILAVSHIHVKRRVSQSHCLVWAYTMYIEWNLKPLLVNFVYLLPCRESCENIQRPVMIYYTGVQVVGQGNSHLSPVYQQSKHIRLTILDYCVLIHLWPVCSHH